MEHTANFGLTQWEKTDRIQMEDFNANNAILEAALSKCGNCRIETGTYIGTGTHSGANPTTLTFSEQPEIVFVASRERILFLLRGCEHGYSLSVTSVNYLSAEWTDTTVSWFHTNEPLYQLNGKDQVHTYFALFRADK